MLVHKKVQNNKFAVGRGLFTCPTDSWHLSQSCAKRQLLFMCIYSKEIDIVNFNSIRYSLV